MKSVVFVMGSGHCGSTLLDLILGSHEEAFSLGELARIGTVIDAGIADPNARICGVCAGPCPFWDEQASKFWLRLFYSRANPVRRACRKASQLFFNPYAHMLAWSGRSVLVDSSKSPAWIRRQLRLRYRWSGIRPCLIYLHRDGRAVVSAYYRKYPERGLAAIADSWRRGAERMESYFDAFEAGPKLRLSYEALATQPEATMRQVCEVLGLRYDPQMLCYWKHEHHHLFGNGGTRNLIYRYREKFAPLGEDVERRIERHKKFYAHEYYDQVEVAIRLDERWRRELSPEQLEEFDRVAGATNARYRYEGTDLSEPLRASAG